MSNESYRKYYDMITKEPGMTLAYYAKQVPSIGYTGLKMIITHMEYYGYLLAEFNEALYPYKIVHRYPEDLHCDPVSRNTRWKRTGTTCEMR